MNRGNRGRKVKTSTKAHENRGKVVSGPPVKKTTDENKMTQGRKRAALGNITNATQNKQMKEQKPSAVSKKGKPAGVQKEEKPADEMLDVDVDQEDKEEELLEEEVERERHMEEDAEEGEESLESSSSVSHSQGSAEDLQAKSQAHGQSNPPRNPQVPPGRVVPNISPPEDANFRYDSTWLAVHLPDNSKVINTEFQLDPVPVHLGVRDIDSELAKDWTSASVYAREIFHYYRLREEKFLVEPYMHRQKSLSVHMRAILVDWLVELQENFELNHETLYLGVKITDIYLSRTFVRKENLQLTGAVALYIACKYDERIPPSLDELLFICDGAYNCENFLKLEREMFQGVDFDIGMPLSYRFLRRYARCAQLSIETLTLARYILEMSLMHYQFVTERESLMAAAALLLALKMKREGSWDVTLQFHTEYQEAAVLPLAKKLNSMLHARSFPELQTVESKYTHSVFHEVTMIPLISDSQLCEE